VEGIAVTTSTAVRTPTPTSAAGLLAAVRPFGPEAEGESLAFDLDPPEDLLPALRVLHTGLRAALTDRTWWGCGSTRKTAAARRLDPSAPIPPGITLLAVEGDARWDRIDPAARLDLPHLFGPPPAASGPSGPLRSGPPSPEQS
jgi:hypothetical protein